MERPKFLCQTVHLKAPHASASASKVLSAHQTGAELLRFIRATHLLYTFSVLAFCGFPNLTCRVRCEARPCGKSTPAFTLRSVFSPFLECSEPTAFLSAQPLTKIFSFFFFLSLQSFSLLCSHCTLIAFTKNNTRICHS